MSFSGMGYDVQQFSYSTNQPAANLFVEIAADVAENLILLLWRYDFFCRRSGRYELGHLRQRRGGTDHGTGNWDTLKNGSDRTFAGYIFSLGNSGTGNIIPPTRRIEALMQIVRRRN